MTPKEIKKWQQGEVKKLEERVKSIKKNGHDFIIITSDGGGISFNTNIINKFYRYGLLKGFAKQAEVYEIEGRMQLPQILESTKDLYKEISGGEKNNNVKINIKKEAKCQKKRK